MGQALKPGKATFEVFEGVCLVRVIGNTLTAPGPLTEANASWTTCRSLPARDPHRTLEYVQGSCPSQEGRLRAPALVIVK
jgi:hypothetical protein